MSNKEVLEKITTSTNNDNNNNNFKRAKLDPSGAFKESYHGMKRMQQKSPWALLTCKELNMNISHPKNDLEGILRSHNPTKLLVRLTYS